MGNSPRTNNPYQVGGGGTAPAAGGGNDPFAAIKAGSDFTASYDRNGMAQQMATMQGAPRPPSNKTSTAMTTPPKSAMDDMSNKLAAVPAAAPAVTPAAAPAAPAVTPAATPAATPAVTPAATTPAATTPAPAVTTPAVAPAAAVAAPANPVGKAVYTPPKAAAAAPKAAAAAPKSTQTVIAENLKANPGQPWTPAQIKAGGRWEIPAGAPKGAIGRNFVKYVAPAAAPVANNALRDVLATIAANTAQASSTNNGMAYYPRTIVLKDPKTGQPFLNPDGTPMTTQVRGSVLQGGSSHGGGQGGGGEHA